MSAEEWREAINGRRHGLMKLADGSVALLIDGEPGFRRIVPPPTEEECRRYNEAVGITENHVKGLALDSIWRQEMLGEMPPPEELVDGETIES